MDLIHENWHEFRVEQELLEYRIIKYKLDQTRLPLPN